MFILLFFNQLDFLFFPFAALKRSFDNEDIDDMASFTSASPVSDPISPSSCHFILGHSKEREAQGGVIQTPSFAFNNNSIKSEAHPHIGMTSNPIPALKSRAVGSSLSFNRGTMNRPVIYNNGSSVTRAASFQSKLNPNICSQLSGPGSDNDSLHSSTSSLEYSGGGGYLFPTNKLTSYHSPLPQREYQGSHFQHPQVESNIKKLLSHESGFKSEINPDQGMLLNIKEPQEVNQGSLSNLHNQIPIEEVGMQRGGSKFSPGTKFIDANINWNSLQNVSSFGEGGINKVHQQGSQVVKTIKPRAKEIPRLNKFPLDLDSFVISTSPNKVEAASRSPDTTKVSSHNLGGLQHIHSAPSTASTSASLSSLDSSSDTPCHSFNTTALPMTLCSPLPSHSSIPVPEISSSVPLSPSDSFQLNILSESEIVCVVPSLHSPSRSSNTYSPRPIESVEDGKYDASDSVDLILQRIASFSWPVTTDTQTSVAQSPTFIQSNGGLSSKFGCPIETTSTTSWKQGEKKHGGKLLDSQHYFIKSRSREKNSNRYISYVSCLKPYIFKVCHVKATSD